MTLLCPPTPCASCPYRRDAPPGIWDASEYRKLAEYDDAGRAMPVLAPFHCHQENVTGKPTLCRGWIACHGLDSVAVRLAVHAGLLPVEQATAACPVPVYSSGKEACAAGLKGVRRPGARARRIIEKLGERRARPSASTKTLRATRSPSSCNPLPRERPWTAVAPMSAFSGPLPSSVPCGCRS